MGMTYCIKSISDKNIELLLKYPVLFHKLTWPEGVEEFYEIDDSVPPLELSEPEGAEIDLYKAWHGIHFLLTKSGEEDHWPFNFLLNETDAKQLEGIDDGYGSGVYDSSQVKEISQMLTTISEENFKSYFDPEKVEEGQIYACFGGEPVEEKLEWLSEFFNTLKVQMESFANNDLGVVVWLM